MCFRSFQKWNGCLAEGGFRQPNENEYHAVSRNTCRANRMRGAIKEAAESVDHLEKEPWQLSRYWKRPDSFAILAKRRAKEGTHLAI